jgi:hypothetical protein
MRIFKNRKILLYWVVSTALVLLLSATCFTVGYAISYKQNVSKVAQKEQIPEICVSVYNRCLSSGTDLIKMERQKYLCLDKLEKAEKKLNEKQ